MSMERTLPPCCMLRGCGQYNRRGVANRREGVSTVNVYGEDSTAMLHVKGVWPI